MLDKEMGNLAKEILENNDINLLLENNAIEIRGTERVENVELSDGTILDTHIVIVATGIKPNLEFLKDSGIKTNSGVMNFSRQITLIFSLLEILLNLRIFQLEIESPFYSGLMR